jgi:hypothetical protein
MSVSSILAFVLLGARAFTGPRDKANESPKRASYAELKAELSDVKGERDRQYEENAGLIARIAELEDDVARANVQFRRDQDLIDIWRARALYAEAPAGAIVPAGPDYRPQSLVEQQSRAALQRQADRMQQMQQAQEAQLAQYAQLSAAQYNAQQAMNAQNFYGGQGLGQGLLGAQNLDAGLWCNCVPSRSQVWAATDPE